MLRIPITRYLLSFFILLLTTLITSCEHKGRIKLNHKVNVPGTKVLIPPPPGFTIAKNFIGLTKANYAVIQIMDLDGGNYFSNAATFNKESFEAKGITVFEYKERYIDGYQAKFVCVQGTPDAKGYCLVFGDSTFSVSASGFFPPDSDRLGDEISYAIQSISYDKNIKVDPAAIAVFRVDDSRSKFKFSKYSANLFMYTEKGVKNDTDINMPSVLISTIPIDNTITAENLSSTMINSLKNNGLTNAEIKNAMQTTVNGNPAFECEIYGKLNGKKSLIYQLVVTHGDKSVVIQGSAKSDFNTNLIEFKSLAETVIFK